MNQDHLLDGNLYKVIAKCYVNNKKGDLAEIYAVYVDGTREVIWTFNSARYDYSHHEFLGKTKIEAVFHCDRKQPRTTQLL